MIISFLNQKGGVGKTMLATHLAMGLATRKGLSVLYVDADPQASAIDWRANRRDPLPFEVVGMPKPVLHESVPKFLEKGYQACIIDGPGKLADVPRSAIMASDIVLIPVQPSPYDVWSSSDIVEEFRRAKIYKPDIRAAFVINRRISNTRGRPRCYRRARSIRVAHLQDPRFPEGLLRRDCGDRTDGPRRQGNRGDPSGGQGNQLLR